MHCTVTGSVIHSQRVLTWAGGSGRSRCWQGLLVIICTLLTAPLLPTPGTTPWCLLYVIVRLLFNKQCTKDSLTAAGGRLSSTSILLAPVCLPCSGQSTSITSLRQGWWSTAEILTHCCRQLPAPEGDGSGLSQEGSGVPGVSLTASPAQSALARHGSTLASEQTRLVRHGSTMIPVHSGLARQGSVAAEGWDGQAHAGRDGGGARRNRRASTSLEDKEEQGDR